MENCDYTQICKYNNKECIVNSEYYVTCWVRKSLDGILDKQVFKTKILKRVHRSEHGH